MTSSVSVTDNRFRSIVPFLVLAIALAFPIAVNRFPIVFPDTGAYLDIAYNSAFGIERASGYGFFLKPMLLAVPGLAGIGAAMAVQLILIAAIASMVARRFLPPALALVALLVPALLSSWPWHASQLMPDAFTAIVVLLAWLFACGDLGRWARLGCGALAVLVITMHYTHVALFAAVLAASALVTVSRRKPSLLLAQLAFPIFLLVVAVLAQIAGNARYLGRPQLAPAGSLFLYARLNEDGLIRPWLDRHCNEPAIADLCRLAPSLDNDSQVLLWDTDSPIGKLVWLRGPADIDRWPIIDQMGIANRGAIAERPLHFLATSARGAAHQSVTFGAVDDECPRNCAVPGGFVATALAANNPPALRQYARSREANGGLPVGAIRAVTTPATALAILLLPLLMALSWRRGDRLMLSLLVAVTAGLVVNATLAGALSDVHDRYQSRVAWLAMMAASIALLRWRAQVTAARSAKRGSA